MSDGIARGAVSQPQAAPRRALRLLVVSDEMEVGGSQRQISCLLRALPPAQCRAELAYFRNSSFLVDEIRAAGIPAHLVPKSRRIDPVFLWRLARLLRKGRYDVVHCYSFTAELWTRLALGLVPGTALVASMREMGGMLGPLQWRIKRAVCRSARAVISNSEAAAVRLREVMGAGAPPVVVVANGIEPAAALSDSERERMREAMASAPQRPLLLFVGRLVPQKNPGLLLEALARMSPQQRPQLAFAGDGILRAGLQAQALALGLAGEVRFLGERDDAPRLMQAADALVLPSRDEGLSNVLLESMACGLCPIATRVGGTPDLIADGIDGLLFDSGDAAGLQACLERMVSDPVAIRRLGQAAKAKILRRYSPGALAAASLGVYRECLP